MTKCVHSSLRWPPTFNLMLKKFLFVMNQLNLLLLYIPLISLTQNLPTTAADVTKMVEKNPRIVFAISVLLDIAVALLEGSHFFALSTLSAESNGGQR